MTKQSVNYCSRKEGDGLYFAIFSLTHKITYIAGYLSIFKEDEYSVYHDHIWAVLKYAK